MTFRYETVRSGRRSISIEITKDARVLVRAPFFASKQSIEEFVAEHEEWIKKHLDVPKRKTISNVELTAEQIKVLRQKAAAVLAERTEYFSELMGLVPASVKITSARTRFGSCSAKKGICFSLYLLLYPPEFIDYVVVHELCHLKHMNHGKRFHELLEEFIPNHRLVEKLRRMDLG